MGSALKGYSNTRKGTRVEPVKATDASRDQNKRQKYPQLARAERRKTDVEGEVERIIIVCHVVEHPRST
jgi:hypothetical protein